MDPVFIKKAFEDHGKDVQRTIQYFFDALEIERKQLEENENKVCS